MAVQDEVPKSRITLTYRTEINGQPETVNLPLRMLVSGDFSLGTSTDRKADLEERRIRSIDKGDINSLMKDMKMLLDIVVENKVDPEKTADVEVHLPVESMKSFSPDEIVKHVPKLKALMLLKKLLLEAMSNVSNKKAFQKMLSDLYTNEEAFKKLLGELKGFEGLRLPKKPQ
jgi:type VI secretion system protein ImpB